MGESLFGLIVLPVGLGLLGFVEPCSVGTSLLFLHYLEGRPPAVQVSQTLIFTVTRAAFMGMLGVVAVLVGAVFVDFQKGAWAVMGLLYIGLGVAYLTGFVDRLKQSLGPGLGRLSETKGAAALALLFGLNIPACAGPLLVALLGTAAVAGSNNAARGFVMLGAFGLALSLPIAVGVLWSTGRRALERLGKLSQRVPKVIGMLFILLGAWSIRFALVAEVL
jgi:cytochrome c-type biogenesis protein